jgi:hypothetical protein
MCFVRASELLNAEWFKEGRAQLVLVGSGSVSIGQSVAEELGVFAKGGKLVVDDTRESEVYRAFGTKRGVLRTFDTRRLDNVAGLLRFPLEMVKGRFPTINILNRLFGKDGKKTETSAGDPFLQGGTFVLDEQMNLVFRLIEEHPGYPKADPKAIKRAVNHGERFGLVTVKSPNADTGVSTLFLFFILVGFAALWVGPGLLAGKSALQPNSLPL